LPAELVAGPAAGNRRGRSRCLGMGFAAPSSRQARNAPANWCGGRSSSVRLRWTRA